jgi:hypothetical protein
MKMAAGYSLPPRGAREREFLVLALHSCKAWQVALHGKIVNSRFFLANILHPS